MMHSTPDNKQSKPRRQSLTPKKGQLTGIPRKIKDGVADIYNSVQKWEILKNKGFNIATDIANLKIEKRGTSEQTFYPEGLETLCHILLETGTEMQKLQVQVLTVSRQFKKIAEMSTVDSEEIYFNTWPSRKFAESAKKLSLMYEEEMKAKLAIVESIAHVDYIYGYFTGLRSAESTRNILMAYITAWLHEPCIDEDVRDVTLEEMLRETGHK